LQPWRLYGEVVVPVSRARELWVEARDWLAEAEIRQLPIEFPKYLGPWQA
jgi:hypothetical protein